MSVKSLIVDLSRICPGGLRRNVSLARSSRWRIGGQADVVVEPGSIAELSALRAFIVREGLPSVVVGDTSNLLFSDEGLRAICIRIGPRLSRMEIAGDEVVAEAGVWVPCLARRVQQAGLTGAEHTCGIPGTLGGLICMNGGSQRMGIGSSVVSVTAIAESGATVSLAQADCAFGYRSSIFQSDGTVIAAARLRFSRAGERSAVRGTMLSILRERSRKFPRKQPNCGSVFKSNPGMYAQIGPPGAAIEKLGFKGYRIGDAMVSSHHANFFVNGGEARAVDMLALIRKVNCAVFKATGYNMEPEVRFVKPQGQIVEISSMYTEADA